MNLIIKGNIPYFNLIKKYLVFLSLLSILTFIYPKEFKEFGEISWKLLILVLYTSILSKIFPKINILKKILILRRSIGIIIGSFILAHLIGFLLINNVNLLDIIKNNIFDYSNFLFWGIWGAICMLFPLVTSNNLSQKILKKKWRIFQSFTYLFFFFGATHIYFITGEYGSLILFIIWVLLKIYYHFKKRF